MRTSLQEAKAELFGSLRAEGTTSTVAGVTTIYDHHCGRGEMKKPVTVTVTPALISPDFWTFAVRVYAWIGEDAATVEALLEQVVAGIEDLVGDRWGPSDWKIDPHPSLEETVLAEWLVECGREDD